MQVADASALDEQIRRSFGSVPTPPADQLLAEGSTSEDALELAAALRGKHWTEVPIETLFFHREMLPALSPVAFRAYVGAYLTASLIEGPYAADLLTYILFALKPLSADQRHVSSTQARLAALDADQHACLEAYVRYWDERESAMARDVLADWR